MSTSNNTYLKNRVLFFKHVPDAHIYSQLSKLDKSSTSSRAEFLFGATVNAGQKRRSHTAFSMECAKGICGLEVAFDDEDSPSACMDEFGPLSSPNSLDFAPETYR